MKLLLLLALSLLLVSPAPAQATGAAAVLSGAPADTTLRLHPGDVIRLRIWREPDLSGDFPVDESGVVVFPKIGPRKVLDESPASLKDALVKDYQVFLRNPSIDVILLRRVNVLGAVKAPGLYPVDPTMTLADVIAAAGGVTPQGKLDQVNLIRDGVTVRKSVTRQTKVVDLPLRSGDQLFVPERSWASRNPGVIAASITAAVSLIIAVAR